MMNLHTMTYYISTIKCFSGNCGNPLYFTCVVMCLRTAIEMLNCTGWNLATDKHGDFAYMPDAVS